MNSEKSLGITNYMDKITTGPFEHAEILDETKKNYTNTNSQEILIEKSSRHEKQEDGNTRA